MFRNLYIDQTGNTIIDASDFQIARSFSEGLAAVLHKERYWGFINNAGEVVIKTQFSAVGDFSEGLAAVRIHEKRSVFQPEDKWGYIDKTGRLVLCNLSF